MLAINKIDYDFSDMVLIPANLSTDKSGLIAYESVPWTGGLLPIKFSDDYSSSDKLETLSICNLWSEVANVKCVEHTTETNILFAVNGGCYSTVGMSPLGSGEISVLNCNSAAILHEFGHAFGLAHEHQRPDRNQYLAVDPSLNGIYYYDIIPTIDTSRPYDFSSIMHYAFNESMQPHPNHLYALDLTPPVGQQLRPVISSGDAYSMKQIYGDVQPAGSPTLVGEIAEITSTCSPIEVNCSVIIAWTSNATNSRIEIRSLLTNSTDFACVNSPCTRQLSPGRNDFYLKTGSGTSGSIILDYEVRNLNSDLFLLRTSLSINGISSHVIAPITLVNAGDILNYEWQIIDQMGVPIASLPEGIQAKATYTVDSPACGIEGVGPYPWPLGNSPISGTQSASVLDCQRGRTYTIHYQLEHSTGLVLHQSSKRIYVRQQNQEEPIFTASHSFVRPGETIYYEWAAPSDAVDGSASFTVTQSEPSCGTPTDGPHEWPAINSQNFRSGNSSSVVVDCQVGKTYFITYKVQTLSGLEKSKVVKITVLNHL